MLACEEGPAALGAGAATSAPRFAIVLSGVALAAEGSAFDATVSAAMRAERSMRLITIFVTRFACVSSRFLELLEPAALKRADAGIVADDRRVALIMGVIARRRGRAVVCAVFRLFPFPLPLPLAAFLREPEATSEALSLVAGAFLPPRMPEQLAAPHKHCSVGT
jgi:hypothetical protein